MSITLRCLVNTICALERHIFETFSAYHRRTSHPPQTLMLGEELGNALGREHWITNSIAFFITLGALCPFSSFDIFEFVFSTRTALKWPSWASSKLTLLLLPFLNSSSHLSSPSSLSLPYSTPTISPSPMAYMISSTVSEASIPLSVARSSHSVSSLFGLFGYCSMPSSSPFSSLYGTGFFANAGIWWS